jgi:hypothetical protein
MKLFETGSAEHFTASGLRWRAVPGLHAPLVTLSAELRDWNESGDASVVKATPGRSVRRIRLGGSDVYLKRHRMRGPAERAKYAVLASRARSEWRAARALAVAGIPCAPALAIGERRRGPWLGEALYLALAVPGLRLDRFIAELRAKQTDLRPLISEVVSLQHRLVRAGFAHPDLHDGNLIARSEGGRPRLALVDLHALRRRTSPLGFLLWPHWVRRSEAKLAHSLSLLLAPEELAFALSELAPGREPWLRREIASIDAVRRASRDRRCLRESSEFTRVRRSGYGIWRRRRVELESLVALLERARMSADAEQSGSLLVRERGAYGAGASAQRIRARAFRLARADALAGWKEAHALALRGEPGPIALACAWRHFPRREAWLVVERGRDARDALADGKATA